MRSLRNRSPPASAAGAAPETISNVHGVGEGLPSEAFVDNFLPNEKYLHVTNHLEIREYLQQIRTSHLNLLASPFDLRTGMQSSGGSGSEAASGRESPDNFTTNLVTACTYTDDHSIPTNAIESVQNSPIYSPGSTIFSIPVHGQQFANLPTHPPASPPYFNRRSLVSARGSHPQGLGIRGVSYGAPHDSAYGSGASSMTYVQDNTPSTTSEQDIAGHNRFHAADTAIAQMAESEFSYATACPEDIYNVISEYDTPEGHSTSCMTYPAPDSSTQNVVNIPSTPRLDHNNYTRGCVDTPRTTNTPTSSLDSDGSPRSTIALRRTQGMSQSVSSPTFTAFKNPAQSLTAWQMVEEATHRPTMDLVEVPLQHRLSRDQHLVVESMDYRDLSWQGRSDEHKGWTPYANFADFPDVLEMLQNMRSDPSEYMPDNATIFKSLRQVDEWRENEKQKSCRNQDLQDEEELPRTDEEKAAIVKLLFKAFKSTVEGQSNEQVMRHFRAQVHSNAHVEAICWQLLEAAIQRSKEGPLCRAYEPGKPAKSAGNRDLKFAQRINALIQALTWEKSVCVNLLRAPKVLDAVDYPSYLGKRTGGNRNLNKKKAEIAKLGKMKLQELQNENADELSQKSKAASRPPTRRGKRSKEQFDDSDSDSPKASPRKRRSPDQGLYATPARRFAAVNTSYTDNGYPQQITSSSSAMASNNSSPPSYVPSPAPSTTSSIRGQMSNYNLNSPSHQYMPLMIPPSPFRPPASLATVNLPPHRYTSGFEHQYSYVAADGATDEEY